MPVVRALSACGLLTVPHRKQVIMRVGERRVEVNAISPRDRYPHGSQCVLHPARQAAGEALQAIRRQWPASPRWRAEQEQAMALPLPLRRSGKYADIRDVPGCIARSRARSARRCPQALGLWQGPVRAAQAGKGSQQSHQAQHVRRHRRGMYSPSSSRRGLPRPRWIRSDGSCKTSRPRSLRAAGSPAITPAEILLLLPARREDRPTAYGEEAQGRYRQRVSVRGGDLARHKRPDLRLARRVAERDGDTPGSYYGWARLRFSHALHQQLRRLAAAQGLFAVPCAHHDETGRRKAYAPLGGYIPESLVADTGRAHEDATAAQYVPLSEQALAILRGIWPYSDGSELVFPSIRSVKRPLSENAFNFASPAHGLYSARGDGPWLPVKASTILNERGFDRDVIEAALAREDEDQFAGRIIGHGIGLSAST